MSANSERVVCPIGQEATQIGCWGEQVPSEIVVEMVDTSCHSPLWWAAICHSGRASKNRLSPHLTNPGLQHTSVRLLLVFGTVTSLETD
jgi:hypothetical protein